MVEKKLPVCENCEFYIPFLYFVGGYCRLAYKKTSADSSCKNFKLLKWYVQEGYEVGEEEVEK